VTFNERLDYFGRTVNIAARVQDHADGNEICISETVRGAPGVDDLLASRIVTKEQIGFKGIDQMITVFRVSL